MTRISVETEKLRGFTAEGEVLTARDIEEMVAPDTDFRVYELSDAAARGDRAAAFRIANAFIADKLPPVTLMSGLYSHFRRLLYAAITAGSSDEIARLLNVKPYAARAAAGQARRFTPRRLKRIADTFHDYETAVKSGKMNDYGAFILTIARIAESAVTA
jgi:DNA polymerase III delta subunit